MSFLTPSLLCDLMSSYIKVKPEVKCRSCGILYSGHFTIWTLLGAKNFDIDGVWSLKDLSVPKASTNNSKGRHGEVDSWNLNVGKNYYSRHGLLGGEWYCMHIVTRDGILV